jgi:hypothetical protein
MRPRFVLAALLLGSLSLAIPRAHAQATAPAEAAAAPAPLAAPSAPAPLLAPPVAALEEPPLLRVNKGSIAREVVMGVLAEALGVGLSFAFILPTLSSGGIDGDEGDTHSRNGAGWAYVGGFAARPLLVGGFVALGGRGSGGQGRAGVAIAGAIPGAVLCAASWPVFAGSDSPGVFALMQVLGHVGSVAGAVLAYRASARISAERLARAMRYAPTPYFDREHRAAGLSLSGRF